MDRAAAFADATPALVLARRPGRPRAGPPPGRAPPRPTWSWSAAATPGCGPRCWPSRTTRRADVVLLEGDRCGWAASGRNGGFCAASLTHGLANGIERFPDEIDTLERLGRENLDAIEATVAAEAIDCDFERTGELDVATEPHQVAWLREAEAQAVGHGARPSFLDRDELQAEVHSPTFLAGLWDRDGCALVNPARLAWGLRRGLRAGRACASTSTPGRRAGADGRRPQRPDGGPHRPRPGHGRRGWPWPPTPRRPRSGGCASTSCPSTTTC